MRLGTLAIVGVGLIGGSIGKAAKQRGLVERIVGVEPNPKSALWAVENGVLDAVAAEVPAEADLIALCVPSDLVAQWVITLADHPATIFDVGSVKSPIIKEIEVTHTPPPRFVPCHPISGSEKSGPQAADGDLFDGCTVVLTPLANTASAAQQACASFWEALGASLVSMTADEHDAALAVTSHLPHLLAFAFMEQVTDQHLPLTGGGFRDFSRIAAANPDLWWRIMQLNQGALSQALEDYSNNLRALADAIESGDESQGLALIKAAAQKRRAADSTAQ